MKNKNTYGRGQRYGISLFYIVTPLSPHRRGEALWGFCRRWGPFAFAGSEGLIAFLFTKVTLFGKILRYGISFLKFRNGRYFFLEERVMKFLLFVELNDLYR